MTISNLRQKLACWCGNLPSSPRVPSPLPGSVAETNRHIASQTTQEIQQATPHPLHQTPTVAPVEPAIEFDLPVDLINKIVSFIHEDSDLKRISLASKTFRRAALEQRLKNCNLDDLLHIQDAEEKHKFVETLHIDPQLDQHHYPIIQNWEFKSLKNLTFGSKIERILKYEKMQLPLASHPIQKHHSEFSSQLFISHQSLNKINSLHTENLTHLVLGDDFSGFEQCKNLREIRFGSSNIRLNRTQLINLAKAPQLEKLALTGSYSLTTANGPALKQLPHLKSLEIDQSLFLYPTIFNDIAQCPALEHFAIHDAHENQAFEGLKTLMMQNKTLKSIHCRRFWIAETRMKVLQEIAMQQGIDLNIEQAKKYTPD